MKRTFIGANLTEAPGIVDMGLEPTGYGPDRLGAILKADHERWGPPIRASGFKPGQ